MERLKSLEYLNLALNAIEMVENTSNLESLEKLDLTANFIKNLSESLKSLSSNRNLKEIYFTGNPCTNYSNYRLITIKMLPTLKSLDGIEIRAKEKIQANNIDEKVLKKFLEEERRFIKEDEYKRRKYNEDPEGFYYHCPESKLDFERNNDKDIKKENKNTTKKQKSKPKKYSLVSQDGKPLNVNQPNLKFEIDYSQENFMILKIFFPKFLGKNELKLHIEPDLIRITVFEEIFQLTLMESIECNSTEVDYSEYTGILILRLLQEDSAKINCKEKGTKKIEHLELYEDNIPQLDFCTSKSPLDDIPELV